MQGANRLKVVRPGSLGQEGGPFGVYVVENPPGKFHVGQPAALARRLAEGSNRLDGRFHPGSRQRRLWWPAKRAIMHENLPAPVAVGTA